MTGGIERKIGEGYRLAYDEAVELEKTASAEELCELAGKLRRRFTGNYVDTCSIMNARSGRCSENCKWCSQSGFHKTDIETYPLVEAGPAVEMAKYNAAKGIRRFSLVTSGRTMGDGDIERCCKIFREISDSVDIGLCASMGLLNRGQLKALYDSGVKRYHCNLETAPSYFPELCTTHTTGDKIDTIRAAQQVGMEICSGGIIGMGESMAQRIELAVTLREMDVRSVPVNILNPIKGTPLENTALLTDDDILRSMAMFRIVNPEAHIRFAGGRILFKHLERRLLHGGVSASIMGDMLTTAGAGIDGDREMFREEGFVM